MGMNLTVDTTVYDSTYSNPYNTDSGWDQAKTGTVDASALPAADYSDGFIAAGYALAAYPSGQLGCYGLITSTSIAVDATGGSFKITVAGQETAAIDYNETAANVETALEAISTVTAGDVVVTGGPGDDGGTTPYVLTWQQSGNLYGPAATTAVETDATSLTGGNGTAAVTNTVPTGLDTCVGLTIYDHEVPALDTTPVTYGDFTVEYSGHLLNFDNSELPHPLDSAGLADLPTCKAT